MKNRKSWSTIGAAVFSVCAMIVPIAVGVAPPAAADVCNLGFEDGVVAPWVAFNSVGTTSASIQTAARTGSYCVRLEQSTAGNKGGVYLRFPVTPGQTYSISAYCLSSSANNAARMRVDAAGGTNYNTYTAQASQSVTTTYTLMNCGTVTATGSYITVFLAQESAASNVRYAHYDDVSVVPAPPGSAAVSPSTVASGGTASFSVTGAYGTRVGWYGEASCTTLVGTGNPFVLTNITSNTTLYARNEVTCGSVVTGYSTTPSSVSATVTVTSCTPPAAPTNPSANPASVNCGQSSTLSASVESGCTVDWYTGSCGGTLVGSGTTLVVNPTSTTVYYPRARRTSDGCVSTSCGATVTVTTAASPAAPTSVSANPSTISSGQSSTLSASVESGCTVDWYTGSCGGTLVGSGTSLVVTPGSTTAYYPRARNTTTGCTSVNCGSTVTVTVSIPPSSVRYVKPHVGGTHDGLSWATAFDTVQEAVSVASSGEEVWVAAGTYVENVILKSGVAIYGGFAGTETARSQRNWAANVTVLDGDGGGSVVEVERNAANTTRIDGFTIRNGSAITGGGIYCNQGASPVIVNNIITGNQAAFDGGGVFCNLGSAAVIASNRIISNSALTAGGGVRSTTGAAVIANNIIAANSAQIGGAIACGDSSTSSTASHEYVINNTMVSNAATSGGGAIYCYGASSASVSNNIVYYNSSGIRKASGTGTLALKKNNVYANVAYNYSGVSAGSTDISSDPQLASAGYGNLHIQPGSPCRNAGDNTQVVSGYLDVDNQTRIQNTTVDIGADESDGTTWTVTPLIVRVSTTGSDSNSGSSWAQAKRTIQAAVDAVWAAFLAGHTGGEVWVKAGTYSECLSLRDYASVYGGFAGTETARTQRNWNANTTTIDAGQAGAVVTAANMGYRVGGVDGFTLRNGRSLSGAGVGCYMASPIIMNNKITANSASGCGGGIYLGASLALVKANSVITNQAKGSGGGVHSIDSAAEVSRNNIEDNTSCINGSGVFISTNDSLKLINNRIVRNHGDTVIGGTWGSAVSSDSYGNADLICNTIADNTSATGAIYCGVFGYMEMFSNIVAFNSSGIVKDAYATVAQTASYTGDPVFVNRSGGDYRLQSTSPCIDVADVATAPSEDYAGNGRPVDGNNDGIAVADIGCYEFGTFTPENPVPPTSATATPSSICGGASSTLHANGGSGTTLRWLVGGCDGSSVGTGNDLVVYPAVTTTYYCRWETVLGNSTCASTTVTVTGQGPTATVGPPQSIPEFGTTQPLGGNTPTPPATGQWSIVSGGTGTFSNPSDPNATFTHTGGDGPIVLRWTVSSPPCDPAYADVTVSIGYNCLQNGDFDGSFTSGVADGWTKLQPEAGAWARETSIIHSGVASQKITDASGAPSYTTFLYQTVQVKPGKVYVPTMWIYRVNSAVVRIGVDPNGGTAFVAGDAVPTSNQWVYRVNDPFTAGPSGMVTIGLATGYQTNSGTAYFDDVAIKPQSPQSVGGTATITAGNSATLTASGGFGGSSDELCWYTGPNGTGDLVGKGTALIVWPTVTTTYYPRWETTGLCSISDDGASVTVTVLPPAQPPTVTSITPASGANTGTVSVTDLAGTNFVSGAGVKLRRGGYTDINASSVVVSSPTKITCVFDLTGRKTGLWDVVVTNPDAQYGVLAHGFGVGISASASIVGTTLDSLLDPIGISASLGLQFRVWGVAEVIDSSSFWLDDGSGTRIRVFAPGYTGVSDGDFVSVVGTVDVSVTPPVLVSSAPVNRLVP